MSRVTKNLNVGVRQLCACEVLCVGSTRNLTCCVTALRELSVMSYCLQTFSGRGMLPT